VQVNLTVQNNAAAAGAALPGVRAGRVSAGTAAARYDLDVGVAEARDPAGAPAGLRGAVTVAADLFDAGSAERVAARFARVLAAVGTDLELRLHQVEMLDQKERAQILTGWNDTAAAVPAATLAGLFEAQVARVPDAVAVACGAVSVSYGELDARANQLARVLAGRGAGPEQVVAVMMERSAELMVALLAVLKAGAAYLPVDPGYPAERIRYMLADAGPAAIVVTADHAAAVPPLRLPVIVAGQAERADAVSAAGLSDADRAARLLIAHPAYVIYTSGSTGTPKGVLVSQAGFASLAAGQARFIGAGAGDRVAQFASSSFDTFGWEWCMALLSGAALVVVPAGRRAGRVPDRGRDYACDLAAGGAGHAG
jgi:non-ribosomal peptide synthetase component F